MKDDCDSALKAGDDKNYHLHEEEVLDKDYDCSNLGDQSNVRYHLIHLSCLKVGEKKGW